MRVNPNLGGEGWYPSTLGTNRRLRVPKDPAAEPRPAVQSWIKHGLTRGSICWLAFTRYCFTSELYCGSQSSFYCPPPTGKAYPIAIPLHDHCSIYAPPHRPPCCMPYTRQDWWWQYCVRAKLLSPGQQFNRESNTMQCYLLVGLTRNPNPLSWVLGLSVQNTRVRLYLSVCEYADPDFACAC